MIDVIVIAGTADARKVIGELLREGFRVAATVATKLGRELLEEYAGLQVYEGKLTAGEMAQLLKNTGAACLVDASHPFAREVSLNAIEACTQTGIPYLRYERAETVVGDKSVLRVRDFKEAAEQAARMPGNILFAAGSNHLDTMMAALPDYRERLFVRVLPDSRMLARCEEKGIPAAHILAIQGPFSVEMNLAMLAHCKAGVLITKDSGDTGGAEEKLEAAARMGTQVILVERPPVAYPRCTGKLNDVAVFVREVQASESR